MSTPFFDEPILNSPYEVPTRHHSLDDEGQPLNEEPRNGRRLSALLTPVPKAKRRRATSDGSQSQFELGNDSGIQDGDQDYDPTPINNLVRRHVDAWRSLPNPADWGVTPTTARLLSFWRDHEFESIRPFFCQIEAVETRLPEMALLV